MSAYNGGDFFYISVNGIPVKLRHLDICGRWLAVCRYAHTDTGLAVLVNCSVCPVKDATGLKCGPAWPHFRSIGPGLSGPGRAGF